MSKPIYQLEKDGVTMTLVESSLAIVKQHACSITETRNEDLKSYGENPFEIQVVVDVPLRNKSFIFVGKGKDFEEAAKNIEVDVRREIQFWKFCIGENKGNVRFPAKEVDPSKQRNPQFFHGGESDATRATSYVTGQTHPHRHNG